MLSSHSSVQQLTCAVTPCFQFKHEAQHGHHDQHLREAVVVAHREVFNAPALIRERESGLHRFAGCLVAPLEEFPEVRGTLLILGVDLVCRAMQRLVEQLSPGQPFLAVWEMQNAVNGSQNSCKLAWGTRLRVGLAAWSPGARSKTKRVITYQLSRNNDRSSLTLQIVG